MKAADDLGIPAHNRVCTGDVVAYCADPSATWDRVHAAAHVVAGNCERQLGSGGADCGCGFAEGSACDLWSAKWYAHAAHQLAPAQKAEMSACPDILTFTHHGLRGAVIHGGVTDNARFIWPSSSSDVFENEIAALQNLTGQIDLVIAGHCGIAFAKHVGQTVWINAGVIGMPPHDGRPETRFLVLKQGRPVLHRLTYDAERTAHQMQRAGLPDAYARSLVTGIWPNEDILPNALRR